MTTPRLFECWLEETLKLQKDYYGHDPGLMEGEEFADFAIWNSFAAISELVEMMDELDWKPWAKVRARPNDDARHRAVGEIVDVLHFVANLAVALRVTDAELSQRYDAKMSVNRERMRNNPKGYDARGTKCPNCKRALDDIGTTIVEQMDRKVRICNGCGASLD